MKAYEGLSINSEERTIHLLTNYIKMEGAILRIKEKKEAKEKAAKEV